MIIVWLLLAALVEVPSTYLGCIARRAVSKCHRPSLCSTLVRCLRGLMFWRFIMIERRRWYTRYYAVAGSTIHALYQNQYTTATIACMLREGVQLNGYFEALDYCSPTTSRHQTFMRIRDRASHVTNRRWYRLAHLHISSTCRSLSLALVY
ncbi:hypothetical protein EDD85DRAFT_830912 [Armillaria nabsnona]|nr:hypothetical protein EDD85DRAFT_830912 [Armillaria nabsnona]